jgi:non-homologous end joining protein Ku
VRERVLEAIQAKVEGQDITADVKVGGDGKIIDLMEALKASLEREKPEKAKASRKVS